MFLFISLFSNLTTEERIKLFLLSFLALFIVLVIRNWYNLFKKRSFRSENEALNEQMNELKVVKMNYDSKLENISSLKIKLERKHNENINLKRQIETYKQKFNATLSEKEREIEKQKNTISHQERAYESYVNYKNVEANNTRLGAHFIKNVINQIYNDLEDIEASYKTFFGFQYKKEEAQKKLPSIKALKSIFKLLDYNVAALNKESIAIEDELDHIHMFLDLIRYLKPNAKIELNDLLSEEQRSTIKIKPTLFFPFVENALKHGSLNDFNSFISIDLKENDKKQLNYCLVNSTEENRDITDKNNFGLNALKQLIDAYYPGSKLECKSLPNKQYVSELTIAIN